MKWIAISVTYKLFKRFKSPFKSRRVLVVRLDAIGDYILFRNFLQEIRSDKKWREYRLTLLGNISFRDIGENLDGQVFERFIWINPDKLNDINFFKELALRLKLFAFDYCINPIHSRRFVQDQLLKNSGCKKIIGSAGDLTNFFSDIQKEEADLVYDELIPADSYTEFEFLRNRAFFGRLLGNQLNTDLSISAKVSPFIKNDFLTIIVFPGAGAEYRKWSVENFSEIINLLFEYYGDRIRVYIAGAKNDEQDAKKILSLCDSKVEDLSGKTSLIGLIDLIASSTLLISNETSAVHIAAAVNTPAICISNGNHFGRFNPYPPELKKTVVTIYPLDIFYNQDKNIQRDLSEKNKRISHLDINTISARNVLEAAKRILDRKSVQAI